MAKEFNWSSTVEGWVFASFLIGYLATQIIGGALADRFGGKIVLGTGLTFAFPFYYRSRIYRLYFTQHSSRSIYKLAAFAWSIFTLLTPLAAKHSLFSLTLCRICLGIGEGAAFPSAHSLVSAWIPQHERTRAITMTSAIAFSGSISALPASSFLGSSVLGWESIFYVFGGVGLSWCMIWYVCGGNSPESEERCLLIEEESSGDEDEDDNRNENYSGVVDRNERRVSGRGGKGNIPWKVILSSKEVWAIIISLLCNSWGFFLRQSWLPTFYLDRFGVDVNKLGYYSGKVFLLHFVVRLKTEIPYLMVHWRPLNSHSDHLSDYCRLISRCIRGLRHKQVEHADSRRAQIG